VAEEKDIPPLPRQFWILFAGSLVNRLGSFVVPLFAIYLTLERGLGALAVGAVASCYGLGSLCSGALGGQLADRIGRRRTLIIGLCWGAGAMLLMPYAHRTPMIAAGAFHLGLAGDLYRPAIAAAVADLCTPAQRPRAFGLLYWAVNLGFAFATAVGGLLARSGFARLFVVDAATTFAYAAVVFFFLRETRPAALEVAADDGALREALADRALLAFLAVQLLVSLLYIQTQGALPVALAHRGILSDRYGLIIAENGVLIVILQPFAIRLVERMRRTRALAIGALLTGLGFGMNALPLGVAGAACSVAVWTLGEIIGTPVIPSLISDLAPARLRGRYQGLSQMSFGACSLIGPTLGMLVLERGSAEILWRACACVGIVAAFLFLALARPLRVRLAGRGQPA
jgi:MFS family permease